MAGHSNWDIFFVEHPKCGRTWIRFMLLKAYSLLSGERKDKQALENVLRRENLPSIGFTHQGLQGKSSFKRMKDIGKKKPVIFMIRDPRDVIVSFQYQIDHRQSTSEFIRCEIFGISRLLRYFQVWDKEIKTSDREINVIRYEDFHSDTKKHLRELLEWIRKVTKTQFDISDDLIDTCVEYASFENMHKMEKERVYEKWGALRPGNIDDPNTFKTRRGKVGGYKSSLSFEDIEYCNQQMAEHRCDLIEPYIQDR